MSSLIFFCCCDSVFICKLISFVIFPENQIFYSCSFCCLLLYWSISLGLFLLRIFAWVGALLLFCSHLDIHICVTYHSLWMTVLSFSWHRTNEYITFTCSYTDLVYLIPVGSFPWLPCFVIYAAVGLFHVLSMLFCVSFLWEYWSCSFSLHILIMLVHFHLLKSFFHICSFSE